MRVRTPSVAALRARWSATCRSGRSRVRPASRDRADLADIVTIWSAAARLVLALPALELVASSVIGLQSLIRARAHRQRLAVHVADRHVFASTLGRLARGHLARQRMRTLEQLAVEDLRPSLELVLATSSVRPQLTLATSSPAVLVTIDDSGAFSPAGRADDADASSLSDSSSDGPATPTSSSVDLASVVEAEEPERRERHGKRIRGGRRNTARKHRHAAAQHDDRADEE